MDYSPSVAPSTSAKGDQLAISPPGLEDKISYTIWADTARWNSWNRWLSEQDSSAVDTSVE